MRGWLITFRVWNIRQVGPGPGPGRSVTVTAVTDSEATALFESTTGSHGVSPHTGRGVQVQVYRRKFRRRVQLKPGPAGRGLPVTVPRALAQ